MSSALGYKWQLRTHSLWRRFNVRTGAPRNRHLLTGVHIIADVTCQICDTVLGWKYVRAVIRERDWRSC